MIIEHTPFPFPKILEIFLSRKAIAFATMLLFSLATFFSFFSGAEKVFASPVSYFEEVHGNVEVVRKGEIFRGIRDFRIRQNDVIRTDKNASATIHFLDDSVSRLAENSSVKIDRLFSDPFDYTQTSVSLNLRQGRLYAYVLNLINNSSQFEVKAKSVTAVTHKKSAFDISVAASGKTKVSAISHAVDVKVSGKKKQFLETTLTNGFSLEVSGEKSKVKPPGKTDTWIFENLQKDEQYLETLKEEYREKREEQAHDVPFMVFNDIKKEEARIAAASAKLTQAETLFQSGYREEGEKLLTDFSQLIGDVAAQAVLFKEQEPEKAQILQDRLSRAVNEYKKQFSLFLPTDPLYPLKEQVMQADLLLTESSVEKSQKQLSMASEKLIEASSLQDQGESQLAVQQIQAYAEQVSQVVTEMKQLPEEEKQEVVSALLDQNADHLKLLGTLAAAAKLEPPPILSPGETRGINLREMLVQVTRESLLDTKEMIAETPQEVQVEEVNVNGNPVVSTIIPVVLTEAPTQDFSHAIPADPLSGVTVIQIDVISAPNTLQSEASPPTSP